MTALGTVLLLFAACFGARTVVFACVRVLGDFGCRPTVVLPEPARRVSQMTMTGALTPSNVRRWGRNSTDTARCGETGNGW